MQRFEVRANDLIMSCSGTMGKVAIVPKNIRRGIINQALLKLTPSKLVMPEFLKYWMDSIDFQRSLKEQAGGAAIQNVASVSVLKNIQISLPNIQDQQRIVAILDEAFEGIATAKANAEKNLQNARELNNCYLRAVLDDPVFGGRNRLFGEIAEVQSGGTPLVSNKTFWGGGIPWYSSGELNSLLTVDPERTITDAGLKGSNTKLFPRGSLLIGMYDTAALKMSVLDRDGAFNQAIAGVKPNENIDTIFLLHAINSVKPFLLSLRRGVRQKNLSLTKIKEIQLRIPPIAKQKEIVAKLESYAEQTQRLESLYQQKLTALAELKKSLLHQAFSGAL